MCCQTTRNVLQEPRPLSMDDNQKSNPTNYVSHCPGLKWAYSLRSIFFAGKLVTSTSAVPLTAQYTALSASNHFTEQAPHAEQLTLWDATNNRQCSINTSDITKIVAGGNTYSPPTPANDDALACYRAKNFWNWTPDNPPFQVEFIGHSSPCETHIKKPVRTPFGLILSALPRCMQ